MPAQGRHDAGSQHRLQPRVRIRLERRAHRLVADPTDRIRHERARQQRLCARTRDAAALHVEQRAAVELADLVASRPATPKPLSDFEGVVDFEQLLRGS